MHDKSSNATNQELSKLLPELTAALNLTLTETNSIRKNFLAEHEPITVSMQAVH